MAQQFRYLFSPMKIRHKTCKNRIVSTAHGIPLSLERWLEYHRTKAKGGVGLSILGNVLLSKEDSFVGYLTPVKEVPKIPYSKNWATLDMIAEFMLRPLLEAYKEHDVSASFRHPFWARSWWVGKFPPR